MFFFYSFTELLLLWEFFSCEDEKQKEASSFEALQTADRRRPVIITTFSQKKEQDDLDNLVFYRPGNKFITAAHKGLRLLYKKKKSVLTFSLLVEVGADLLFADDVCVGNLEETQVGEQS